MNVFQKNFRRQTNNEIVWKATRTHTHSHLIATKLHTEILATRWRQAQTHSNMISIRRIKNAIKLFMLNVLYVVQSNHFNGSTLYIFNIEFHCFIVVIYVNEKNKQKQTSINTTAATRCKQVGCMHNSIENNRCTHTMCYVRFTLLHCTQFWFRLALLVMKDLLIYFKMSRIGSNDIAMEVNNVPRSWCFTLLQACAMCRMHFKHHQCYCYCWYWCWCCWLTMPFIFISNTQ